MKKTIASVITAMLLAQNPIFIFAVENAAVRSVRVSAESVYVTTDKPVKYRAFSVGQPPKLVLELDDAKLKTLEEIPVNGTFLKRVRTGQYKTSPVSVSRIVMELTQKTVYEVTQKGTELMVVLGGRKSSVQPALKDSPAEVPAVPSEVKIITPDSQDKVSAEAKTEPVLTIKAADAGRDTAPVIAPKKSATGSVSKNIMESLSREPISFDYNDADVREVIGMMAAKAGINIIYSDDVTGSITMNLNKVPFEEAFRTILNVKGLAAQQVGDNIIRIASPQTLIAEQKKAYMQTRVFFLNYSKAADIKTQIDSVAAAESRTANCVTDDANNALVITDSAMGIENTARLIRSLDRAPKQVLIEAKLVEVSLDNSFDLGVNWGFSGNDNKGGFIGRPDPVNGYDYTAQKAIKVPGLGDAAAVTGVNLPPTNNFGGLRLGRIASNYMLDVTIQAAAKKGKAKVLSDPKVATLNNKEANINITNQTPYTTTEITNTSGGSVATTKVTYITTGIVLRVTPTINSDGRITMKISPSVSQPSQAAAFAPPSVDTRSTDTNVIVRDGETIVIGGLIHDSQSDTVYKIPLLGDIPLLGALFRKKSVSRTRMELLIFVTPRIMED